jgi:Gluconate 2-dehydrogenase subunit 3
LTVIARRRHDASTRILAGIAATNAYCRKAYGRVFDQLDEKQREEVLIGLSTGKVSFDHEGCGSCRG